jgi:hypothetical protein
MKKGKRFLSIALVAVIVAFTSSQSIFAQTQSRANASPCTTRAEHRQFDFWIGEWNVETPQGQRAGTNSIQRILDGCVIFENWTGAGGMSGKSFNFYNPAKARWQQTWVDDKGNVLELAGQFKDGAMRLEGESLAANRNKVMNRLTFFPLSPDRVRQLWEQSSDGGKTWSVAFDGAYIKKS